MSRESLSNELCSTILNTIWMMRSFPILKKNKYFRFLGSKVMYSSTEKSDAPKPWCSLGRFLVSLVGCFLWQHSPGLASTDNQAASTFSSIKPTLSLVVSKGEKKVTAIGTAFCIYSSDDTSIFLTNRHVVGKDQAPRMILMAHPDKVYTGAVVRIGSSLDIAVIAVPVGNVPV